MDIFCQVTPMGLVPLYDSDHEEKKKLKIGSVVKCEVKHVRNYEFHKKYFALVKLTYTNLPEWLVEYWNIRSIHDMHKRFKRDLGYSHTTTNEQGEIEREYESIAFNKMSQADFERFYEQAVNLVMYTYIEGIDRQDLIEELHNFM